MNHHHRAKKLKMRAAEASEDVSGFTPSMTSNTDLLSSTQSAQLGVFNEFDKKQQGQAEGEEI